MTNEEIDALNQAVADIEGIWQDYCRSWEYGGPIIERERISLDMHSLHFAPCVATHVEGMTQFGPTPLIAAMRAYVATKEQR